MRPPPATTPQNRPTAGGMAGALELALGRGRLVGGVVSFGACSTKRARGSRKVRGGRRRAEGQPRLLPRWSTWACCSSRSRRPSRRTSCCRASTPSRRPTSPMRHSLDKARVQKANKKQKRAPSGGFGTTVNTMMGLRRPPSCSERRAALLFALLFLLVVTHKYSDIHRSYISTCDVAAAVFEDISQQKHSLRRKNQVRRTEGRRVSI